MLGHKVEHSTGFNREYDLLVNGKPVEVTTDIYYGSSGRICIEHRKLETHTAPTWIYMVPRFFWVKRGDLDLLVKSWPDKTPGGDDGRQGTYVNPDVSEYFHPLKRR